jgi:hypothetical protein
MEVIVIGSDAYREIQARLQTLERLFLETVSELKDAKTDNRTAFKT